MDRVSDWDWIPFRWFVVVVTCGISWALFIQLFSSSTFLLCVLVSALFQLSGFLPRSQEKQRFDLLESVYSLGLVIHWVILGCLICVIFSWLVLPQARHCVVSSCLFWALDRYGWMTQSFFFFSHMCTICMRIPMAVFHCTSHWLG
ncbi:hypothetical protein B0T22DRAFT_111031 [Podospora appendiculata]|uniref:Uncharacterized protein n=1 Tax=Podospora appendiculata TaxID=314037 RepID=A0AAE1CIR9_9PEZI|nr:hypothetical protein B0T22DRAFT_111031 [Podospora appendiculata]